MEPSELLSGLDAEQRHAVTTESHLVAVIAGAGSGKTRVLTRRVAYRIATGSADAAHTVVLTFTRQAAGELRRRFPRLGLNERISAGTFHSVAHGLLRQRWTDLDQPPKTIVTDRKRLVAEIAGRSEIEDLVAEMDWATARGLNGTGYLQMVRKGERRSSIEPQRVADTLGLYRQEKRKRGVIDLDDLLTLAIEAIQTDDSFASAVRWKFRHVLVDEAQDLNPLQHRLIDLFRDGRDDLFLVGDPAQAIYGFNGSDPSLLLDVSERFPGIEVARLPVNHRCTPQVVDAGMHTLESGGQPTDIRSARPDGALVTVTKHRDENAEAAAIAQQIARLDPTLVRAGQVAVLARTHAALAPIRSALASATVAIRRTVDGAGSPLAATLRDAYRIATANQMRQWVQDRFEQANEDDDENVREVATVAADFLRDQQTGDGRAFQAWVRTTDPFGEDSPGVDVATFHASKGREWHTVFLVGCETSLMPHRSANSVAAKAEEARLLYVALTRASDVLAINWSERRGGYQRKVSPLLEGFVSSTPPAVPPPEMLQSLPRNDRQATLLRLHEWRDKTARVGGILPDAVCTKNVLSAIADAHPTTPAELDAVTGLGAITAGRLFDGVSDALAEPSQPR